MLERIELKNFQKHESLVVDFEEGFNLITGHNGWGKSAILRAIQWVTVNDGDSKSFRRTYLDGKGNVKTSSETSVELRIDGHTVKRVYTASKNEYYLDGVKLTGFGRGVPKEVEELCKMQSFNFSEQFAPLFLIGDSSGGSLAKELASIASLEEMEHLTDLINADIRHQKDQIDTLDAEIEKLSEDASVFDSYMPTFDSIDENVKLYVDDAKTDSTRTTEALTAVNKLQSLPSKTRAFVDAVNNAENCLTEESFKVDDLTELKYAIEGMNVIEAIVLSGGFDVLCDPGIEFEDDSDIEDVSNTIQAYNKTVGDLNNVTEDLHKVLEELDTFDVCPLCGNELKECTHE